MKSKLMTTLALSAGFLVAQGAQALTARNTQEFSFGPGNLQQFRCSGTVDVGSGQKVRTHEFAVEGQINAERSMVVKEVTVTVNDGLFASYNGASYSVWVQEGKLMSLGLKARNIRSEAVTLRYAGEGSSQNIIELQKNGRTLAARNITCTLSRDEW